MNGEKIVIINFEEVLEEEIKSRVENLNKVKKELGNADKEGLKEKAEELVQRVSTLESIKVLSPYKIDKM